MMVSGLFWVEKMGRPWTGYLFVLMLISMGLWIIVSAFRRGKGY
jgi:hypothetical protein